MRTTHSAWAEGRFIIYDLVLSSCRCIYGFMAERVGPSGSIHLRRLLCSYCSSWRQAACGRRSRERERETEKPPRMHNINDSFRYMKSFLSRTVRQSC